MKKLLLATGQEQVDQIIAKKIAPELGYEIVGVVNYKKDLAPNVKKFNPDLVIVSKNLTGRDITILEAMITTKNESPKSRILYLAGDLNQKDEEKMRELGTLVISGIYDIIHEKRFSINLIKEVIKNPKQRDDMQYLLKYFKAGVIYEDELVEIEEEAEIEDVEEDGYKNVYLVSSIKPGTGKSFVSTNLATGIAKYGKKTKDGRQPKVAIIEGDLQNLSVGTILQIEDNDRNLKTVMQKISTIINNDGDLIDDKVKIQEVNEFIKGSFKQYYNVKNLYALVGSQLTMEEVENIKPFYYTYLIETILDDFDVIIIDTNSSLAHITTYPLLRLCSTAFYVIDLDFNNIRNNSRYRGTLEELNVLDKVKYILNQDIDREHRALIGRDMVENLVFGSNEVEESGFKTVAKIPEIPKEIFLNRLYSGTPIILDNTDYTLKARIELSRICNMIWEVENYSWINAEYEKYKNRVFGTNTSKKRGFFK